MDVLIALRIWKATKTANSSKDTQRCKCDSDRLR